LLKLSLLTATLGTELETFTLEALIKELEAPATELDVTATELEVAATEETTAVLELLCGVPPQADNHTAAVIPKMRIFMCANPLLF
jgi:hypothetical protein